MAPPAGVAATFTSNESPRFEIGVCYLPARTGVCFLQGFDEGEVREDFDRLREWRLDPVRILPLWEHLQPNRERIDLRALRQLDRLAGLAADRGLHLWLSLFGGHLHQANFLPGWMAGLDASGDGAEHPTVVHGIEVPGRPSDPLGDPRLLRAMQVLIRELQAVLQGHPALSVYDLGERLSSLFPLRGRESVRRLLGELTETIRAGDEQTPITLGLQLRDLLEPDGLRPDWAAPHVSFLSIACTRPADWAGADPGRPSFLAELTRTLAGSGPVWISSLGLPTRRSAEQRRSVPAWLVPTVDLCPEGEMEQKAWKAVELLRRNGAAGALWWCYADFKPYVWRKPPFHRVPEESAFGLVRDDWTPKPTLRGLAAAGRERAMAQPDRHWFDREPEEYWRAPDELLPRLYARFRDQL